MTYADQEERTTIMNEDANPVTETDEATSQKRTEVLSVKTSVPEKDMILRAAKLYDMPYSEFIRMVSLTVCRNMGIEEAEGLTTQDVRRRRPRRKPDPVDGARARDASDEVPVAV
jgi:hypothetical protein